MTSLTDIKETNDISKEDIVIESKLTNTEVDEGKHDIQTFATISWKVKSLILISMLTMPGIINQKEKEDLAINNI